jgi:hypothetical protein
MIFGELGYNTSVNQPLTFLSETVGQETHDKFRAQSQIPKNRVLQVAHLS